MTCMDAQRAIISFINDELNIKELEEFIDHIKNCYDCYEELEVYYTLLTAMVQLDHDKHLSSNYKLELKKKISNQEERIIGVKLQKLRKNILAFSITIIISLLISYKNGIVYSRPKGFHNKFRSDYNLVIQYKSNSFKKHEVEYNNYLEILYDKER